MKNTLDQILGQLDPLVRAIVMSDKNALARLQLYVDAPAPARGLIRLFPTNCEAIGPTLLTLARCAYPLVFETGLEGAEYSVAGSGFLVKYRQKVFVLTAKHCLRAGNENQVRIVIDPTSGRFLPLEGMHLVTIEADHDWADVGMLEASKTALVGESGVFPLDLDVLLQCEVAPQAGDALVVPGYPKCINDVDYEKSAIKIQAYFPSGKYVGNTSQDGVHRCALSGTTLVDSVDGMSGSPVLSIQFINDLPCFSFVGMVIRGSVTAGHVDFVTAPVLKHILDHFIEAAV